MEYVKQYWWVIAGALILLLLFRRSPGPSGPSVVQIGGGDAALAVQEGLAMDTARIGLVNSFLNYALETDRIDRADDLERLRLESSERVAFRNAQAAEVAAEHGQLAGSQQQQLAYQLQMAALQAQQAGNPQWWQYLLSGIGQHAGLLIDIFDGQNPGFGGSPNPAPAPTPAPLPSGGGGGGFDWGGLVGGIGGGLLGGIFGDNDGGWGWGW